MAATDADLINERINSVPYWYHRNPITPDISTPGHVDAAATLQFLEAPESCAGLRVLDLGTRDGGFAFEMERRGAEVVAIDYLPCDKTGFKVAAELLDSKVNFFQENIYQITEAKYGTFDIVLFLGLLYHLPDPMLALSVIRSVCRDQLYVETQVIDEACQLPDGNLVPLRSLAPELEHILLMQFYIEESLSRDVTNYWAPNMNCLALMLTENGFTVVSQKWPNEDHRGLVKCRVAENEALEYFNKIARGASLPSE